MLPSTQCVPPEEDTTTTMSPVCDDPVTTCPVDAIIYGVDTDGINRDSEGTGQLMVCNLILGKLKYLCFHFKSFFMF